MRKKIEVLKGCVKPRPGPSPSKPYLFYLFTYSLATAVIDYLVEQPLVPAELVGEFPRDFLHSLPQLGGKVWHDGREDDNDRGQAALVLDLAGLEVAVRGPQLAQEALEASQDDGQVAGVTVGVVDALLQRKRGKINIYC